MDPFSKTSFDALLDTLVEIETGTGPFTTPDAVCLSDGRDTFPGFDSSAPHVMAMAQQEVAHHQALYAQILQQQQRLESMTQGLEIPRFQQPAILSTSTSAPNNTHSPGPHQRPASPNPILPPTLPMPSGGNRSTLRLSLDGRQCMPYANNVSDGRDLFANMGDNRRSFADPAYLSDSQVPSQRLGTATERTHMASDGEALPSPFPRVSLQNLGVMQSHSNDDFHVGGIDVHSGMGSDRRREKNRIAQRRFRERQKTTVAVLQTELDQKEAEMQRMTSQLRYLEETNQVLTAKLLQYEKTFGVLPGNG